MKFLYGSVFFGSDIFRGVDGVTYIINHTKMKGLICDDATIENALLVSKNSPSISFVIFIPNSVLTKPQIQEKYAHLIKVGLKIYYFNEVERMGKKNNSYMLVGNSKPDDVSTLICKYIILYSLR